MERLAVPLDLVACRDVHLACIQPLDAEAMLQAHGALSSVPGYDALESNEKGLVSHEGGKGA
jgi:hypothetical protein